MLSPDQVAAMNCRVCRVPLAMSERQGIEIDYCPQCRGVWLDRGELDKIIERFAQERAARYAGSADYRQERPRYERDDDEARRNDRPQDGRPTTYRTVRRRNLLRELFDFD